MKFIRMNYKQQRIIEEMLQRHVTSCGEHRCEYINGASDASVAAEARIAGIPGCKNSHVAHVRRHMFGELRAAKVAKPDVNLGAWLAPLSALTVRVEAQQYWLDLVMDYLTRTHGVNWAMEEHRAAGALPLEKPAGGTGNLTGAA